MCFCVQFYLYELSLLEFYAGGHRRISFPEGKEGK